MKYWEDKPITFKHFYHFPGIASSAGYDFNYFDVLSMNTRVPDALIRGLVLQCENFIDTEVRYIPKWMFDFSIRLIVLIIYFTTFPVIGYFVYKYLKRIPKNENRHKILKMCYIVENKL